MSGNKQCQNNCGYDGANQRHNESYWEDRTDPREKLDDKDMRFNSHYDKVVDRQIAENHHNDCLGGGGGNQSGGSGQSGQTGARK